jgi:hypothetical protein
MLDGLAGWAILSLRDRWAGTSEDRRAPRCGVDRFPFPARDEERVHVEGGVADRHRNGPGVVDVDTEFSEAFPTDGLARQLA